MKKSIFLPILLSIALGFGINTAVEATSSSTSSSTPNITQPRNSDVDNGSPLLSANKMALDPQEIKTYLSVSILKEFTPSNVFLKPIQPDQKMEKTFRDLIINIRYIHFNKIDFLNNNEAKAKFLELYLKTLDPTKSYFTQSQVDDFVQNYQYTITSNLGLSFKIYRTYVSDVSRFNYTAAAILLSMDEQPDINTNIEVLKPKYASYVDAQNYSKDVYDRVLSMIIATKLDKPTFTWDQIRVRIIKGLLFKQHLINNYDPNDVFKLIDASLALACDSHSDYYSPADINLFTEQIKSSFVGIGVGISQDSTGVIKFGRILKDGPSYRNGRVKKDDELLAVSQDGFNWQSVQDMQLSKVIKLLKGKKNTHVWVRLLSKSGELKTIEIERGEVSRQEIKAELTTYTKDGKTYGILHFGSFYDGLTNDIAKLLDEHRNLSGLIVDLRNNGGGLVSEVLGISNLFIGNSVPIFQTTSSSDAQYGDPKYSQIPDKYSNVNSNYRFTQPLIVLVNSLSASASEIFAAAVQDYRRGLIIGSDTFGKGTVQSPNYINGLNEKEGLIKLTIQKFFRVNGNSTQFKGVTPNVILPPIYYRPLLSELGTPNPLPYTQIQPNQEYHSYRDYYVTPGIIKQLNNYVANYGNVNIDYKDYVDVNHLLIAQQANKYSLLNYKALASTQKIADDYAVSAYNKFAQINHLPGVKTIDELENLDIDKTLDPYLDLTKNLLVIYQHDLTNLHDK